jgi:2-amino-4-hydroxy-6-hydroxymethyldihydropteridine diphosphokinase
MSGAVLSLGSNMGDRAGHLRAALSLLGESVVAVSPVYETAAWGPIAQDDYLNLIALVEDPSADAATWLVRCHACEQAAGRTREVRWGPRTLDADVIAVWDAQPVISDDPDLTLPHPRAHERAFVLVPWLAVAPDAMLPGYGRIADLVAALDSAELDGVVARADIDPMIAAAP